MASYASFSDFIQAQTSRKVYVFLLKALKISDGTTVSLYWGVDDHDLWDGSHYFFPILQGLPRVSATMSKLRGGHSTIAWGRAAFGMEASEHIDPNGAVTMSALVSDYTFSGQEVIVKAGGPGLSWSNWQTILRGYTGEASFSLTGLSIPIYSRVQAMRSKTFPPNIFGSDKWDAWESTTSYTQYGFISPTTDNGFYYQATTGGTSSASEPSWPTTVGGTVADGTVVWTCRQFPSGTDGQVRPLAFGKVSNIAPTLIDQASNLYMVHDPSCGPVSTISAVYIDGLLQTSGYTINNANGLVWFASDPQGTVTLDVQGDTLGGVYSAKPGNIWQYLLTEYGGIPSGDIDSTALTQYNTDVPYDVGVYFHSKGVLLRAIDQLFEGLITHWGDTRSGTLTLARFKAPSGPSVLDVDDTSMLSFNVAPSGDIYYRITIKYDRNWAVNSSPNKTVTQNRREWLKEGYREVVNEDAAIKNTYPLAKEIVLKTNLTSSSAAETVAGWWRAIFGQRRYLARIAVGVNGLALDLGDVVKVTTTHFGFAAGRYGRVTKLNDSHNRHGARVKLELFI